MNMSEIGDFKEEVDDLARSSGLSLRVEYCPPGFFFPFAIWEGSDIIGAGVTGEEALQEARETIQVRKDDK